MRFPATNMTQNWYSRLDKARGQGGARYAVRNELERMQRDAPHTDIGKAASAILLAHPYPAFATGTPEELDIHAAMVDAVMQLEGHP